MSECVHGETGSGKKTPVTDVKIIEMHLESKLISSAGQRTGYGNKKRDVIRSRGI